jgi:hypothetical protein
MNYVLRSPTCLPVNGKLHVPDSRKGRRPSGLVFDLQSGLYEVVTLLEASEMIDSAFTLEARQPNTRLCHHNIAVAFHTV